MPVDLLARPTPVLPRTRQPARVARRERRRLRQCDRHVAHLAELRVIEAIIGDAAAVVASGWIQHGWFRYRDEHGRLRTAGTRTAYLAEDRPVTGACLVGAVVQGAGGPRAAHIQAVQRALDLIWHTLYRGSDEPVSWGPAPDVRLARVRDLTRWNDRPHRTADDVTRLLSSARLRAAAELRQL